MVLMVSQYKEGIDLLAGYEISGVVDEVGSQAETDLLSGDRVIVYQEEDIGFDDGYVIFQVFAKSCHIVVKDG